MLCKNYGIIHFAIGNHTLVGVQRPSLAPQNGGQVQVRLHRQTLLGSKITSVGLSCAHKIIQIFERNSKPVFSRRKASSSLWSHVTSTSFIVDHVQKLRNHSFYNRKPHTFWCSATLFSTPKRRLGRGYTARSDLLAVQNPFCGRPLCSTSDRRATIPCTLRSKPPLVVRRAPLKRLHCRCYAKNAETSSSSSSSEYNVTVTQTLWITLCYGWRVGIVQPKCVTASAVTAAAVND